MYIYIFVSKQSNKQKTFPIWDAAFSVSSQNFIASSSAFSLWQPAWYFHSVVDNPISPSPAQLKAGKSTQGSGGWGP